MEMSTSLWEPSGKRVNYSCFHWKRRARGWSHESQIFLWEGLVEGNGEGQSLGKGIKSDDGNRMGEMGKSLNRGGRSV